MAEEGRRESYLIPVPDREGVFDYTPEKESPSFEEILERISAPIVLSDDSATEE